MKLFVALHVLATVVIPAKFTELRNDPERGDQALTWAVVASVALALALVVGAAITSAGGGYASNITYHH